VTNADRIVRKLDLADFFATRAPEMTGRSYCKMLHERICKLSRAHAALSAAIENAERAFAKVDSREPN
jgi:hypothetical protein